MRAQETEPTEPQADLKVDVEVQKQSGGQEKATSNSFIQKLLMLRKLSGKIETF